MKKLINVFIIEDDPMVSSINTKFIQRLEGFTVVGSATGGDDSIEVLKELDVDLLLLDIYLPGMNGLEIAKKIREFKIPTDIIMITAATDSDVVTQALRLGIVDYIIKPFDFARFSESMRKYQLRHYGLRESKINQEMIDVMTQSTASLVIDKGINKETLHLIKDMLNKTNTSTTAKQLSESLLISRVTARRYLDYMSKIGILSTKNEFHKVGRPEKIYYFDKKLKDRDLF